MNTSNDNSTDGNSTAVYDKFTISDDEEIRNLYKVKKIIYDKGGQDETEMPSAYNFNNKYIGNIEDADFLCKELGIRPETISDKHSVCSIGYSEKDEKYYGWSHRAIHGFKIGDKVKKGDVAAEYLEIGFEAKTKEDTKEMAIAFAKGVG